MVTITVDGVDFDVPSSAADTNWAAKQIAFEQAIAAAVNSALAPPLASVGVDGLLAGSGNQSVANTALTVFSISPGAFIFGQGYSGSYEPTAGTTIPLATGINTVEADVTGGAVTMTATPTLKTAGVIEGTEVTVINYGANDFIIQTDSHLSGTALFLTANTLTLKNGSNVRLRFINGGWYQVGGCPVLL